METLLNLSISSCNCLSRPGIGEKVLLKSVGKSKVGFLKAPTLKSVIVSSYKSHELDGNPASSVTGKMSSVILNTAVASALGLALSLSGVDIALARPVGVNRPELLPKEFTPVIDVAGFLSPAQEGRITQKVNSLEDETGFKLRVLAQNYPETPGLAIKEFWKVDDNTIVFVADPNMGNILNFNVGALVDLNVPRSFWSRLAGKYGNIFFWREKGEDASIEAAVEAIGVCLREPAGPRACSEIS